jgi:hypothetical protein
MTKFSFLYFIVCIVPVLLIVNLSQNGFRRTLVALIAFTCCSAPAVFYLLRWGDPSWIAAKAGSFGVDAETAYIPLLQFLEDTLRDSPSVTLSLGVVAAALVYLLIKRRLMRSWPDFLAFLIVSGFAIIALSSANRQIRYAFPAIVALPFLAGILMSGNGKSAPSSSAALAAGIVFCGLLAASVLTGHRGNWESLTRSNAILAQAVRCNSKRVLLATDSPTLNINLVDLASEFSASRAVNGTLSYNAFYNIPLEEDFRAISESDLIVFQDESALSPPYANERVSEYKRYIQQRGHVPIRVAEDVSVYSIRCGA